MLQQPILHRAWCEVKASFTIRKLVRSYSKGNYKTSNPWRIGFIGCGRIARRHGFGYLLTGRARLVAGADPNPKALSKATRRLGLESAYLDFRQMLESEDLDIVSICAPPRFHAEALTLAVQKGVKGILCEKPIALDLNEADQVLKICEKANVKLTIGHQRRFGPQHQLARKILNEDTIGQIRLIVMECPRDILRAGIHAADFLRFYGGEVESVTAQLVDKSGKPFSNIAQTLERGFSGDTHGLILANLASGVPAVLRIENRGGVPAKIQILGQKGEIEVWFDGGLRYRGKDHEEWQEPELNLNPYLQEFHTEIENLFNSIQNGQEPAIRGIDGRKSLEIILAILTSAEQGREITLPLASERLVELPETAAEGAPQPALA